MRIRRQRTKKAHFCLLVNKEASGYSSRAIRSLINSIKRKGATYTVLEPDNAQELLEMAQIAARIKRDKRSSVFDAAKRGKVSALIACGGDGTFNLVSRAAHEAGMPMGVLPLGRHNNIARSLLKSTELASVTNAITAMSYCQINTGQILDQHFVGSVGIGFVPALMRRIVEKGSPRFSFGWGRMGSAAYSDVELKQQVIRIDSFRFEDKPHMVQINLLPYTLGLSLSPASVADDDQAEIIFDSDCEEKEFADFARKVAKGQQLFGTRIKQFRGRNISFQPAKGEVLYLDGELLDLPTRVVEVAINEDKLKVFC